jgi:hypothetical protein
MKFKAIKHIRNVFSGDYFILMEVIECTQSVCLLPAQNQESVFAGNRPDTRNRHLGSHLVQMYHSRSFRFDRVTR